MLKQEALDVLAKFDGQEYEGVDFDGLKFSDSGVTYKGKKLGVPDELIPEFSSWFGVPSNFAKTIPWRLQHLLISYKIADTMEKFEAARDPLKTDTALPGFTVVRDKKTGLVTGFTRGGFTAIENSLLFQVGDSVVKPVDYLIQEASVKRTEFTLLGPKTLQVEVGDILRGGLNIQNSFDNSSQLEIGGWIQRLACANGATRTDMIKTWRRGTNNEQPAAILKWAEEIAAEAWGAVDHAMEDFASSKQRKLELPELNDLDGTLRSLGLSSRPTGYVLEHLAEHLPETLYDVINGITWVGTHDTRLRNAATRRWMQMLGGNAQQALHSCPVCHTLTAAELAIEEPASA